MVQGVQGNFVCLSANRAGRANPRFLLSMCCCNMCDTVRIHTQRETPKRGEREWGRYLCCTYVIPVPKPRDYKLGIEYNTTIEGKKKKND